MKRKYANSLKEGKNDYKIKRVDEDYFKGYICLLKLKEIEHPWIVNDDDYLACVFDNDYEWLEVYPDNEKYAITIIFDERGKLIEWYIDMIKTSGIENGIPYIDDLYLDLVIRPNGNSIILDEDELQEALTQNDITKEDFQMAYDTMKMLKNKYCNNLEELIKLTNNLYKYLQK